MALVLHSYAVVLGAATLLSLLLAGFAWRRRPSPGATAFTAFMLGAAEWQFFHMLEVLATDPTAIRTWADLQLVGAMVVSISWFFFAVAYAGRRQWITQRSVAVVSTVPVLMLGLLATNEVHHLLWETPTIRRESVPLLAGSFQVAVAPPGVGVLVGVLYTWLLFLAGSVVVFQHLYRTHDLFRRQGLSIVGGIAVVWFGNILQISGRLNNVTPLLMTVSGVIFFFGIVRYRTFDVTPVARDAIVESVTDSVAVIDREGRVVDANPSMLALIEDADTVVGQDATETLPPFVTRLDWQHPPVHEQVAIDGGDRYLDVQVSTLRDADGTAVGTLVACRDVTRLKRREEELDLLKQVLGRVLRHDIRNQLSVIDLHAQALLDGTGDPEELAEKIAGASDRLQETTEKARLAEDVAGKRIDRVEIDAVATVESVQRSVEEDYPEATVDVTGPDTAPVLAVESLQVAIYNAVENAVVHTDEASADVRVERDGDTVTITVEDFGRGVPRNELEVLEEGQETPLKHGSGLGLWLIDWVIDRSGGSVAFEHTGHGTLVTMTLDAA